MDKYKAESILPYNKKESIDQVVLVKTGEYGELGVHGASGTNNLARMADGIHGVLDAADVGVLRRQTRHQLGAKIGTRTRREIVENHGQLRHLGDTAKVNLRRKVGRAKIIRGDREHGVGAHFLSIACEIEDVGIRRIAHSSKDLHAAGNTVHSELQSLLLLVEAHAVKLADASRTQDET